MPYESDLIGMRATLPIFRGCLIQLYSSIQRRPLVENRTMLGINSVGPVSAEAAFTEGENHFGGMIRSVPSSLGIQENQKNPTASYSAGVEDTSGNNL